MKAVLKAGASIDVLSPDEYDKGVKQLSDCIRETNRRDYFQQSYQIAAGSDRTTVLYDCPLGSIVQIHRIAVSCPGYDGQNPLTSGSVDFLLNNDMIQFLPVSGIVAPVVMTDGSGGIVIHGGEALSVRVHNLTETLSVFAQFRRWTEK